MMFCTKLSLMNKQLVKKTQTELPHQYYALYLWDPAVPAYCSFSKLYIGDREAMERVAEQMDAGKDYHDTAKAIRAYFAGNLGATHIIAYQEIPVLEPVEILADSYLKLPAHKWDHMNIWKRPQPMTFAGAEVWQLVVHYDGMYRRCVRTRITDLMGTSPASRRSVEYCDDFVFGNACVLSQGRDRQGDGIFETLLFVQEDEEETPERLLSELNDPEKVIFKGIMDEIFGDG